MSFALPVALQAAPVTWSVNGHSYEAVFAQSGVYQTWDQARVSAAALTFNGVAGYLATFTTQAEQEYVINSLGGGAHLDYLWLGGYQDPGSPEPYGGWHWITGETWLGVDNDNNTAIPRADDGFNNLWYDFTSEDHLITWWGTGGINDFKGTVISSNNPTVRGFIVEFNKADAVAVPEPGSLVLAALGLAGLSFTRRKRRSAIVTARRS